MDGEEDSRTMKMKCNLANAIKESRNNEGVGERERERNAHRVGRRQDRISFCRKDSTVQCSAVTRYGNGNIIPSNNNKIKTSFASSLPQHPHPSLIIVYFVTLL